ncbi:transposase, partial [Mycobacterium avium]|uniref:transposase n=1 Tax=Mycobacterium avium TaxID=1764 RepID=UPI000AE53DB6
HSELQPDSARTPCSANSPSRHCKQYVSPNPLERRNKEIERRTPDVGVLPNPAAQLRLAGSVLVEAHDEWQVAEKRYLSETTLALLHPRSDSADQSVAVPAAITA